MDDKTATHFATPEEAEHGFYTAFSNADADAMKDVWLNSPEVACIHPMSQRINGHKLVIGSWASMFKNQGPLTVRVEKMEITQGPVLSVHSGIEIMHQDASEFRMQVTNVYQITDTGWKMLLHHSSPIQGARPPSRVDSQVH